jgi:hypothetical protein
MAGMVWSYLSQYRIAHNHKILGVGSEFFVAINWINY